MRRLLLRPTLLEFCRTHLIFTAAGALFTVLTGLVTTVFHLSETIMKAAPPDWSNASKTSLGTLPVLLPLLLCLAAYLPAGRLVRLRNGWARPEVPDALVLLLAPAAAFWVLVGLGALIPHGYGLTIAAALLNSPAYGLFTLYMVTTGWGITAPPWAGYVGALVSRPSSTSSAAISPSARWTRWRKTWKYSRFLRSGTKRRLTTGENVIK